MCAYVCMCREYACVKRERKKTKNTDCESLLLSQLFSSTNESRKKKKEKEKK